MLDEEMMTKLVTSYTEFLQQKMDLGSQLYSLLETKNKEKLMECVIENMVEDVFLIGKMRYIAEVDPTGPISDLTREELKAFLFEILL